jgi:hypothetical protein
MSIENKLRHRSEHLHPTRLEDLSNELSCILDIIANEYKPQKVIFLVLSLAMKSMILVILTLSI